MIGMNTLAIILIIIAAYTFIVAVPVRLIVPFFGYRRRPIGQVMGQVPADWQKTIDDLHQSAKSDYDFLQKSYEYVTTKYHGARLATLFQFWKAFGNPYTKPDGFLPCTVQNHLIRTMLIKSGRFTESDIRIKVVPFNLFIHQYLDVYVSICLSPEDQAGSSVKTWVHVDPWSHIVHGKMGERSAYFG